MPRANVHVVSDGSTDDTVAIARRAGATVIETSQNVGKAGALAEAIERLGLIGRFGVLMLLDADTRVEPGYFEAGLAMFDDPAVVAVAGCVRTARGRALTLVTSAPPAALAPAVAAPPAAPHANAREGSHART